MQWAGRMIVQWLMEGKSLPTPYPRVLDRVYLRDRSSLCRYSMVNMLVLRRIAGCLCEGIETTFCRALSSRVPIKDIASSALHDVSGDITVLVSLHLKS